MTLSNSTRLSCQLHEDELRVISLSNYTEHLRQQDVRIPKKAKDELDDLMDKSPRNVKIGEVYWDDDRESDVMTEEQVATFWEQVYFFSFANFGLPVPDSMLIPLESMRNAEKGSECFTPLEKDALEYFNRQVTRHSPYVPVPNSVKRRLWFDARVEHVTGEEEGYDIIPACNCPHCWMYMEDMARFMEHLWERHSVVEKPDNDKHGNEGNDVMMDEGEENEDMRHQETFGQSSESKEEETQERKDSGYEPLMPRETDERKVPVTETERLPPQRAVEPNRMPTIARSPSPAPSNVEEQSEEPLEVGRSTTGGRATLSSPALDLALWRKLLVHPLRQVHEQDVRAHSPDLGHDSVMDGRLELFQKLKEQEEQAQRLRSELPPFMWFQPYPARAKYASPISSPPISPTKHESSGKGDESVFKLPTMPASQMRKQSASPTPSPKSPEEPLSLEENRYWICEHDEDCKMRFDSLVVYVEHLTERGFIVYKTWKEHNPTAGTKLKDLRICCKGI